MGEEKAKEELPFYAEKQFFSIEKWITILFELVTHDLHNALCTRQSNKS